MASKEFTVFAIDLSPCMGEYNNGRKITDLEFGLKYFYNHVSDLIIKDRKQDRIAVVLCHSPITKNLHSNENSLNNIQVIYKNEQFTYQDLKECSKQFVANSQPIKEIEGDCLETMLVGVGLFKETVKYKLTRNLVIITNANSPVNTFNSKLADATVQAITKMNINVYLNCIDMNDEKAGKMKKENIDNWSKLIKLYNGKIFDTFDANRAILYQPPLKKVRPVLSFLGNLRFGGAIEELFSNVSHDTVSNDNITIGVQVVPAVKVDGITPSHQFVVNRGNVDSIGDDLTYYIKNSDQKIDSKKDENKSEEANDDEKQIISRGEWDDGFRYSNMDMIALDKELMKSTKLPIRIGMDIYGFIKKKNLPFAYFTKEASYVIPCTTTSKKNLVSFNALCKSLIDLKTVALVRYVPNPSKDVETCALSPQMFTVDGGIVYGFILVRLAYKEDEKIGRFPNLTSVTTSSGTSVSSGTEPHSTKDEDKSSKNLHSLLPSASANELMESYILSKDLDNIQDQKIDDITLNNPKVSLVESDRFPLPNQHSQEFKDILTTSSPAIHKFNFNLKKILIKSLKEDNMHEYLNDKNFIQKVLVPSEEESNEALEHKRPTNLFNLSNVLSLNGSENGSKLLEKIDNQTQLLGHKLIKELGIKVVKEESKKRGSETAENEHLYEMNKNRKPNYGQSEGGYDETIDLNKLLG